MKRILVLEDQADTRTWFSTLSGLLGIEADPDDFVRRALTEQPDILFLDHDLGCKRYVPYPTEITGTDVARALAEHWPDSVPRPVCVIHSHNLAGVDRMASILGNAGFPVLRWRYSNGGCVLP